MQVQHCEWKSIIRTCRLTSRRDRADEMSKSLRHLRSMRASGRQCLQATRGYTSGSNWLPSAVGSRTRLMYETTDRTSASACYFADGRDCLPWLIMTFGPPRRFANTAKLHESHLTNHVTHPESSVECYEEPEAGATSRSTKARSKWTISSKW